MTDLAEQVSAETPVDPAHGPGRLRRFANFLRTANVVMVTILSIVIGLAFGAVLVMVTTPSLLHAWAGFFSHPWATISLNASSVWGAYEQIFIGSIVDPRALSHAIAQPSRANFAIVVTPLSSTLTYATPLILAGLGIAVGFRTALFNIGGAGQFIGGAIMVVWVGTSLNVAGPVLIPLEIVAGLVGGALVASVAGVLKAFTGAHEVIVTMMMNYVMYQVLLYVLVHPPIQQPGDLNGQSKFINASGHLPLLFGWLSSDLQLNLGFVIAIVAVVAVWWLLKRSTLGFELVTVGEAPDAARTAGISVRRITVLAMCLSGALVGLAGMTQVSGIDYNMQGGYGGTYGFDAITVALLGRNTPLGVFLGAMLFGALEAGGHQLQNIDYSLAIVIQAVIVFCVATPGFVIEIFRLKDAGAFSAKPAVQGWVQ